ncbi:MAG: glycosyltransferase [Armatimonadota bacterium]|nr:glycosyltransferase [Armatimonadota bacterium]MCX7777525.1 glycosyltransferase [Armatimonadota bacterium]MDW8026463.1 glycosyltransferase [Armatimonadota bacterium]
MLSSLCAINRMWLSFKRAGNGNCASYPHLIFEPMTNAALSSGGHSSNKAMMRVCIIAGSHPPLICGIGDYTAPLGLALHRLGVRATLLVSSSCIPQGDEALPYKLVAVRGWSLRYLAGIARIARECKPDVMHFIYPARAYGYSLSPILLPYILVALGYPIVLTLHEFKMAHVIRKLADIIIMLPMDGVLVPSSSERDAIVRFFPPLASKVKVSTAGPTIRPIWLSESDRRRLRERIGIQSGEFVIAYFGFIHPHKGTSVALMAFGRLVELVPNCRLMVIGEFEPHRNPYHNVILELSHKLRIHERVLWMGAQPNEVVSHLLQICDAALLPFPDGASTRRGTLIVCIQHGLPVVTVRGEAEVERRFGRALLLVDSPNDYEVMAEKLASLRGDAINELKQAALSAMPSWEDAWDEIARHTISLYNEALSRKRRNTVSKN